MGRRLSPFAHGSRRAADTCTLSLKWCYQLLLDLGGHRSFINRHGLSEDDLAHELGLAEWLDDDQYSVL